MEGADLSKTLNTVYTAIFRIVSQTMDSIHTSQFREPPVDRESRLMEPLKGKARNIKHLIQLRPGVLSNQAREPQAGLVSRLVGTRKGWSKEY